MVTKQLSRPQERYVPQQESYRNLPKIKPTTEPIQTAQEAVPEGDDEFTRLSKALGMVNKAISDFYRMEKSFEETNRIANIVRGKLGMAPLGGQGLLEYGADRGYQEGRGLAAAAALTQQLQEELLAKGYYVDPQNPNAQQTAMDIQRHINEKISSVLSSEGQGFIEGVAKDLATTKVQLVAEGLQLVEDKKFEINSENFMSFVTAKVSEALPGLRKDPKNLREFLGKITKEGLRFGFKRDAAGELALEAIKNAYTESFDDAHDSGNLKAMEAVIDDFNALSSALLRVDSAGIPFGGVQRKKDGTVVATLASSMKEVRALRKEMKAAYEAKLKDAKEYAEAQTEATVYLGVTKGLPLEDLRAELIPLVNTNPELYLKLSKMIDSLEKAEANIVEDADVVAKLLRNPTLEDITELRIRGLITKETARTASGILSAKVRMMSEANRQQRHLETIRNLERKEEARALRQANDLTLSDTLVEIPTDVHAEVTRWAKAQNTPLTPEQIKLKSEAIIARRKSEASLKPKEAKLTPEQTTFYKILEGVSKEWITPDEQAELKKRLLKNPGEKEIEELSKALAAANVEIEKFAESLIQPSDSPTAAALTKLIVKNRWISRSPLSSKEAKKVALKNNNEYWTQLKGIRNERLKQ